LEIVSVRRFAFIVLVLLIGLSLSAQAEDLFKPKHKPVDATDILKALSGNSLAGEIDGIPFVQYFSPTGKTVWQPAAGEDVLGRWRVGSDGKMCTLWDGVVESCYSAYKESLNTIRWESKNKAMVAKRLSNITVLYQGNRTTLPAPPEEAAVKQGFFYEKPFGDVLRGGLMLY
jgi:hypothetical protein